ncbi:hypothetical protein KW797_02960 [Candidatus Parcubacteria bacterium]|nr:hypothetical protein [Candidatus Parcubacteria bacterium]
MSFKLPILGEPEIPDVQEKPYVPLPETITPELLRRAADDLEIQKVVNFGAPAETLPVLSVLEIPITERAGTLSERIQQNALDYAEEGEGSTGVTIVSKVDSAIGVYMDKPKVEKSTDTQGKISNADEDGQMEFDESGANVSTADSGFDSSLYDKKEQVGNWGSDDEDDDGPVSRANVGMESEMADDVSQVPSSLLDTDDDA